MNIQLNKGNQFKKIKISQFNLAIFVAIVNLFFMSFIYQYIGDKILYWLFGILFGFVLQRSRFCITAGFRDIFLIRNTTVTRAVIICLGISTLLFAFIISYTPASYNIEPKLYPVGIHTVVGGFVFGIGMVIAGGCASGTLMRVGEGYQMQLFGVIGFFVGAIVGAYNYQWWYKFSISKSPVIYLPDFLTFWGTVIFQIGILIIIYLVALYWERGTLKFSERKTEKKSNMGFYNRFIKKSWTYNTGAILLALLNSLFFLILKTPWSITTGITHISGGIVNKLNFDLSNWLYFGSSSNLFFQHPLALIPISMVIGSFIGSLAAGEFRIRKARKNKFLIFAFIGGFLMGYSARLSGGCNIGAFLSAIPSFSLHGWVYGLSILFGSYYGGKILLRYLL
ncbi:hypothetical protein SAMN02745227_01860 [Anaerobranca californiensis DSM 14826]|jgi:uncharacterized membrane protein YedE/YeeE|uniref:Uncharacterized protein n=1 Tax=Anaerobranca californiensis DSM 14826 TaxID=1120989 RepID=A0A1M6QUB9_9FIRM|nr:YeeE/YedE family protein [Anaerobranca californiensis]SHK23851.1 hypothetical protein SAMN02745227_01860 [Anaerobranca californiensis DSM 14826]